MTPPIEPLVVTPIGVVRSPFPDRASAPRQPAAARGIPGTIELFPDGRYAHALEDLDRFRYVWVLFWFHLNEGWRSKVLPPRSAERRGVFATRSPYRPNPIGMSVLRLERIEGLVLHVQDVDMIDGTPVLDVKPYLPYTDAVADADHGWLDDAPPAPRTEKPPADPRRAYEVTFTESALAQLGFLRERIGVDLAPRIMDVLALGPSPHPYRRIKKDGDGFRLAVQEWRVRFRVDGAKVTVERVMSGYRPSVLFGGTEPELAAHREYAERFGIDGDRG
jgi:tRNA (adenine37-N6)-methyltransferase